MTVNSPVRILLLEDNSADAELIRQFLAADHFVCEIIRVQTPAEFLAALENDAFDLVLGNYQVPSVDGISTLKLALSRRPDVPFIVFSSTLGEELAVEALKTGATDYVLKSRMSRLVPSIRRALREAREQAELRRSEAALRQNDAHSRQQGDLLSLTHDAILVRDMDGVISYWNRGAEALYGWTAEEAMGEAMQELLGTAFPVSFEQIEDELRRTGRWEGELVHTTKSGTRLTVASRWSLERDNQGAPTAILVTNNDISERKRAEQAREEIEEQWQAAFESNPTMYFIVDAAGNIVSVNPFGAEQLGHNVDELIGQPVLNVFYEADKEAVRKHAQECFAQPGRTMMWEARKVRKDGTMLWVRETAKAVSLKKRPVLLVVCEDITEQKRAADSLRQTEAILSQAQRIARIGVWVTRSPMITEYWSPTAFEMFGIDPAAGPPQNLQEFMLHVHPDDRDRVQRETDMVERGRVFECKYRIVKPDGAIRVIREVGSPVDGSGAVQRFVGAWMDITEQEEMTRELQRREAALQESEEQWRVAFESNPTMYFMVDATGAILSVNPFGAEQLGYSVSELVGRSVLDIFYEPDRTAILAHADDCFQQLGTTMRWEARKIRKDGTMLWVRETANAVSLKNRPVLLVVCEDITEQKRAEDAARRSEKDLRALIENVPAMVFTALPGPSNEFVSRGWREYTGMSEEDTAGSGWQRVVHPADLERHMKTWQICTATGEPYENEARFRRAADGEYRWFLIRAVPLRDDTGNILKWYGVLTDIQDGKRAEALLAGEKRVLELVAKGDPLSEILDSLCRMVEEQASGALASVLLVEGNRLKHGGSPSLPKAYTEAIDGVLIGPSVGSCGTAAYRGQQVIVEDIATDPLWTDFRDAALPHSLHACWSTPIFSPEGTVIGTFAMYYREPRRPSVRDQEIIEQITHLAGIAIQRKLTEEKLQRSQAYLTEAQKLSHTGSFAYNPATQETIYWSEELFRIFGLDTQRDTPPTDKSFRILHPDDRDRVSKECLQGFREKAQFSQEYRLLLHDGTVKHLYVAWHPVLDKDEEVVEYVGTAADVTERKLAEDERERFRQLEADLAHMNRVTMLGELASSLAHEINQPIAATITSANACLRWLAHDPPDLERARSATMRIANDGSRAAEIIQRLRRFYKTGAPPQRESVDVNQLIGEMLVLLRNEAIRHSIALRTELASQLPQVMADRVQIQQVLMNLMLNGIEAMRDGAGELTVRSEKTENGLVLISVSDTGVGLPSEKADIIFNAFYTTKPQGTGMGLAISRSIIEAHGGRLWAAANAQRGATFHFTVPAEVHQ